MITLLHSSDTDVLDKLLQTRERGDVPLVGDDRWSDQQWNAVQELVTDATLPRTVAWASLTSGSSGAPRVVIRTDASWSDSFAVISTYLRVHAGDTVFLPAPASSSLTLYSLAHALAGGPQPGGQHANALHGTPQSLRFVLDSSTKVTTMRTVLVGGSHLDTALRSRAEAEGISVVSYYGAAELSFVAVDTGDGLRAFPGVELDVRAGILWVRSPFVATGYLGAPGPLRTEGSWATVGDLAELTDGVLRLRGRADNAILSASATIVPEEVESALRSLPGVRDAVVIALNRERVGALVAAVIEPEDNTTVSARTLRIAAEAILTPSHRPRRWFRAILPRTSSGKVARAEVERLVESGAVTALD